MWEKYTVGAQDVLIKCMKDSALLPGVLSCVILLPPPPGRPPGFFPHHPPNKLPPLLSREAFPARVSSNLAPGCPDSLRAIWIR